MTKWKFKTSNRVDLCSPTMYSLSQLMVCVYIDGPGDTQVLLLIIILSKLGDY